MTFEKLLQQSLVWRGLYFISFFLVNVCISRFLQAEGAGWLYYISNVFSLILLIASLSTESGFTYFAANNTIAKQKLSWLGILWVALIAIGVGIIFYLYFSGYRQRPFSETYHFIFFGVTYIAGILLINFFTALFYANKNFVFPNLILVISNFLLVVFIVSASTDTNIIIKAYFTAILLQGILLATFFLFQNKAFSQVSLPNKNQMQILLRYSLIALAGNLLFFLMYKIDYWFVRFYCTGIEMGNYIQASKLAQMVLIVPQILASVIFPQTASSSKSHNIGESILRLIRLMIPLYIVLMMAVFFIGKPIFILLFGATFNQVATPFLLLLPGIFCTSVMVLMAAYFSGHGKVALNVKATGLGAIVVLLFDVILIKQFGIVGAAIASTIGYACCFIYALSYFKKMHPFNVGELFSFSKEDWQWLKKILLQKPVSHE